MLKQSRLSNARAPRSRCAPPPTSPAASEAPEDDSHAKQRLERKRATDRAAQREHRKRQKQYVRELETQLELIKSTHGSESFTLLMKENERLQAEVKRLKSFFSAIKGFVSDIETENQVEKSKESHIVKGREQLSPKSNGSELVCGNGTVGSFLDEEQTHGFQETIISPDPVGDMVADSISPEWDQMVSSADDADPSLMDLFDSAANLRQQNATVAQTGLDIGTTNIAGGPTSRPGRDRPNSPILEGSFQERPTEQVGSPRSTLTFNESFTGISHIGTLQYDGPFQRNLNIPSNFYSSFSNSLRFNQYSQSPEGLWLSLRQPNVANPWTLSGDRAPTASMVSSKSMNSSLESKFFSGTLTLSAYRLLTSFEKQLATIGQSRRGSICEMDYKTLPKVLNPPLQEDIYMHEFIERVRSATLLNKQLPSEPTSSDFMRDNNPNILSAEVKGFIGLLWGSGARHAFMAWQMDLSKETFQRIPSWLRPTRIQTEIPHPISIDYMPWPAMRDEMTILSLSHPAEIHGILQAFTIYLRVDLCGFESAIHSGEDHLVGAAICDLRNWKLEEGFFNRYPRWRGLCELPFGLCYDR